jgi:hypothetical protein
MSYKDFIHCLTCIKEGCLNLDEESAEDFWAALHVFDEHGTLSEVLDRVDGLS